MADCYIFRVKLPNRDTQAVHDVILRDRCIHEILSHDPSRMESMLANEADEHVDGRNGLITTSLCHPHVHLDKAFILSHPKFSHLRIEKGTFHEAMELTSKAKKNFAFEDLLERGQRLIDESCTSGVTHIRAFVEVDEIVDLKCLAAGAELKQRNAQRCHIQLCAFAQLPLRPSDQAGQRIRDLMQTAMHPEYMVDVVGSAPYVEETRNEEIKNIQWMIDLALRHDKHLDFHLDYNVDPKTSPSIFELIDMLHAVDWTKKTQKSIVLGHCTRLLFFDKAEWARLVKRLAGLPVSFVGLPTSDLYMMQSSAGGRPAWRTTLPIPSMVTDHGLNAAIGMNNIGNAFTPQGCCDPLYLANLGVTTYQTATQDGTRLLFELVSSRAKQAIGLGSAMGPAVTVGSNADLVIFPPSKTGFGEDRVEDKIFYHMASIPRRTIYGGRMVTGTSEGVASPK